jgi:hypothetical protein
MVVTLDPRHDQFLLFSKFAHLYDAGVPLAEALELVQSDLGRELRQAVRGIVDDIYRGTSLADALSRRRDLFSPELVGVIRAGESRGELGTAARSVADGLQGLVLGPAVAPAADVDAALERAGEVTYLGPGDPLAAALAHHAGIAGAGRGAFLWRDRLVRVSAASTHMGPAAVVRMTGPPGEAPAQAAAWRDGPPRLLLVKGDAELRAVLADAAGKRCLAVDLPAPEAPSVNSVAAALLLEPELIAVAGLRAEDAIRLGHLHAVAWTDDVDGVRKALGAASLPPPESAVS